MEIKDLQIIGIFKCRYDLAQKDPNDIKEASNTVLAQYMIRHPHLIPSFADYTLEISGTHFPLKEGERQIQSQLLQAYTWHVFSNIKSFK